MESGVERHRRGRRAHPEFETPLVHRLAIDPQARPVVSPQVHLVDSLIGHIPDTAPADAEEPAREIRVLYKQVQIDRRRGRPIDHFAAKPGFLEDHPCESRGGCQLLV